MTLVSLTLSRYRRFDSVAELSSISPVTPAHTSLTYVIMATMTLFRTDRLSERSLILLVLFALVFAPFVSAKTLAAGFTAKSENVATCEKMQRDMIPSQRAGSICSNQQNNDCKAHCENLLLSYLPVPVLLEPFVFQARSMRSVQLSSSQIMSGIFLPLDPRPPQS